MKSKITNKIAKEFAIMHLAIHGLYFSCEGFYNVGWLTDDEQQKLVEAVHDLCRKILKDRPENIGHNEDIIKYILEKQA
jgi:hypothetical protein